MSSAKDLPVVEIRTAEYGWRELYRQALFESDASTINARITKAEQALLRREIELFAGSTRTAERDAVISALNSLHALRKCISGAKRPAA